MKKFFIIITLIFTLCCSSVCAKCSRSDDCFNYRDDGYTDCYSSMALAEREAWEIVISRNSLSNSYEDYAFTVITWFENGSELYGGGYYRYYKSTGPAVVNSSGKFVFPAGLITLDVVTFSTDKSCCNGYSYGYGNRYYSSSATFSDAQIAGHFVSSNYDLCDSSGNVVIGGSDFGQLGTIEITEPPHRDGICVQTGSNEINLCCVFTEICILNSSTPVIELTGVSDYELVESKVDVTEDGVLYGLCYFKFEVPYVTPQQSPSTDITVGFYDDIGNYISDTINITCYYGVNTVPDGVEITYDAETGESFPNSGDNSDSGSEGNSGGNSGSNSGSSSGDSSDGDSGTGSDNSSGSSSSNSVIGRFFAELTALFTGLYGFLVNLQDSLKIHSVICLLRLIPYYLLVF